MSEWVEKHASGWCVEPIAGFLHHSGRPKRPHASVAMNSNRRIAASWVQPWNIRFAWVAQDGCFFEPRSEAGEAALPAQLIPSQLRVDLRVGKNSDQKDLFMPSPPLSGIRVLSLAEQYPGPYATMLLADLGADVILVERPGSGDPSRRFPGLFASLNRNKRSIVLNLKNPDDKNVFLQLVDTADVVIEGFRPGVMQRLNLDAAALRQRKPGLIYTSISSFGQQGPLSGVAGHDLSIQAAAGMLKVPIGLERRSSVPVLPMADIASGMFAAFGIVTALFSRSQNKAGSTLDVSMLDSLVSWMTPFLVPPANQLPVRDLPPLDPGYGIFLTRDARQITLSIAGEDPMWISLCQMLGLAQYENLNEAQRSRLVDEIDPVVRKAIASWQVADLYVELEKRGIAFGPVIDANDVFKEPQLVYREIVAHRVGSKKQTFVRQPILFDGKNFPLERQVPELGEHTQEIMAALAKAAE